VSIDESGASTGLARLRGRPAGAARPLENHRLRRRTAAGRHDGTQVLSGAMNGPEFLAYVEQVLVPTLAPGDIVILDSLPAHKQAVGGDDLNPQNWTVRS
jgi:hypothetical protein